MNKAILAKRKYSIGQIANVLLHRKPKASSKTPTSLTKLMDDYLNKNLYRAVVLQLLDRRFIKTQRLKPNIYFIDELIIIAR